MNIQLDCKYQQDSLCKKIVENTEQPIKTRQSMQTGQLMKQAFSKQIKWNVNWIVKSYTKSVLTR